MSVAELHIPGHDADSNKKGVDCGRQSPGIPGTCNTLPTKRGDSPRRATLPWEAFLPIGHDSGTNCQPDLHHHHRSNKTDFKELLSEGKKRLKKAGHEQQLRERAEVVGGMGGYELEDLLADLCEPTFSRRQNE